MPLSYLTIPFSYPLIPSSFFFVPHSPHPPIPPNAPHPPNPPQSPHPSPDTLTRRLATRNWHFTLFWIRTAKEEEQLVLMESGIGSPCLDCRLVYFILLLNSTSKKKTYSCFIWFVESWYKKQVAIMFFSWSRLILRKKKFQATLWSSALSSKIYYYCILLVGYTIAPQFSQCVLALLVNTRVSSCMLIYRWGNRRHSSILHYLDLRMSWSFRMRTFLPLETTPQYCIWLTSLDTHQATGLLNRSLEL